MTVKLLNKLNLKRLDQISNWTKFTFNKDSDKTMEKYFCCVYRYGYEQS